MKLSCIPVTYFQDILQGGMRLEEWIDMAASFGLDGIDLAQAWIAALLPRDIRTLGNRIRDAGLEVCMVRCAPDFTHPERGRRRAEIDAMKKMLETAAVLDAPLVRITAGQAHPDTDREDGVLFAAEGFTTIAEAARACGTTLIYENHTKASVWTHRDFSEDEDVYLRILEETKAAGVCVNFDTANPLVHGKDPLEHLHKVGNFVRCVDANDTKIRGKFEFTVVGRGIVPFGEIFSHLKHRLRFDGWISLEEFSFTGEAGFHEGIEFVRRTWDEC